VIKVDQKHALKNDKNSNLSLLKALFEFSLVLVYKIVSLSI